MRPLRMVLSGRVRDAAEFILKWFKEGNGTKLYFKDVRDGIGRMDAANFKNSIRWHDDFQEFLASVDIIDMGMPSPDPASHTGLRHFTPADCYGAIMFEPGAEKEGYERWRQRHADAAVPGEGG